MCFLSDNIYDYYNVSQGKITIPNMDDGEEFALTDVSFMYWTYLFWSTMHRVIFVYPRTQNQYVVSSFVFTHTHQTDQQFLTIDKTIISRSEMNQQH